MIEWVILIIVATDLTINVLALVHVRKPKPLHGPVR